MFVLYLLIGLGKLAASSLVVIGLGHGVQRLKWLTINWTGDDSKWWTRAGKNFMAGVATLVLILVGTAVLAFLMFLVAILGGMPPAA